MKLTKLMKGSALGAPAAAMAITAASRAAGSRSPSKNGIAIRPMQRLRNVAKRMA